MKIYSAEIGIYSARRLGSLFDSPERAMAAMPGNVWTKTTWTSYRDWPSRETVHHWVSWDNDLDWDEAVSITEVEVVCEGALREPDSKVVQTYSDYDGGWEYLPESDHVEVVPDGQ